MESLIKEDHRVKIKDWDSVFNAWVLVHEPTGMTQAAYAQSLGISEGHLSSKLDEIRIKRIIGKTKLKMAEVMQKSLDKMDNGLEKLVDTKPDRQVMAASEAFKATADRLGLSPQQVAINIQQNNSQNVQVVPLFEAAYADKDKLVFDSDDDKYPEAE